MARRPSLADEAADAFFRLGSGAGLVDGLSWALDHHPATSKEYAGISSDALGKCMSDTLWTTMQPYLPGIGSGLLGGALLALAIILAVRLLARAHGRTPGAAAGAADSRPVRPAVTSASVAGPRGRSTIARYPGTCAGCRSTIRPGDRITHVGRQNNRCATCG